MIAFTQEDLNKIIQDLAEAPAKFTYGAITTLRTAGKPVNVTEEEVEVEKEVVELTPTE